VSDDRVTRRFVYAGRLLTGKGTLCHAWVAEEDVAGDTVRLFPKAKGSAIGSVYTIDLTDDGTSYYNNSVQYTGDRADSDVVLKLEATAHADGVRHARMALEKNHSRESEIKALCAPLRELVGKQVGWANRSALIAYITSEISRG
jgi:hypothetical protein